MSARMKSIALLVGVLVVGLALGALGTSTLQHRRMAALQEARQQGGLMRVVQREVEFDNDEQREVIGRILERAETDFRAVRRMCADSFAVHRETLMANLNEALTPEQQEQLEGLLQRDRESRSSRRGQSGNRRSPRREHP